MRISRIDLPKILTLCCVFLGLTALQNASAEGAKTNARRPLAAANIRFVYQSFDGELRTVCSHRLISENSPYDWKVECSNGYRKFAEYSAHVALSQYTPEGTKLAIELLYWVSGSRLPSEVGGTTWMYFDGQVPLEKISSSQTVEMGTAGLYLEITRAGIEAARPARRPNH